MPTADRTWAAHLLRRAGFGAGPDELDHYAGLGFAGAVERLLAPQQVDDSATTDLIGRLGATLDADTRILDGQALWLVRMVYTQRPLQEKMALFWHNHFATSVQKVHAPALMYQQNDLFRTHGLGRFDALLAGVARDPAMIFWLDNNTNRRGHANENWGREVMELFTIGIGNYSEQDVREVARAFTGWSATRDGAYRFLPRQHDGGVKTVLGHTGNLNGDDVLTILADMRQTGLLLARKLWRWFVNDTPAPDAVNHLADVYVQSSHDITAMLRALFLSPEFRAEANYYATVKNPPEFMVGALKLLSLDQTLRDRLRPPLLRGLALAAGQMGMPLFAPPNVGGWPGGRSWINPGTYFARANFVEHLLTLAAGHLPDLGVPGRATPDAMVAALVERALPGAPPASLHGPLVTYLGGATGPLKHAGLWRLVLSSPGYQLN